MKSIKINYIVIGIITLFLALALWPSISWHKGEPEGLRQIKSRGVLRVSTISSLLTYSPNNELTPGMDYELVKRFAEYLGVKLVMTARQNPSELFDDLTHGRADLLAAGLIYTPERTQQFQAGPAYYSVSQQLVYRKGNPAPKKQGTIKGNLVAAAGSAYLSTLDELKNNYSPTLDWRVSVDQSPTALLEAVAEGRIDYTVGDSMSIALLQRIYPQLTVAFDITDEEPVIWYLQKQNDDLYAALLDFFNTLNEEGTLARLEEKYLGHVGNFDYVDTRAFLRAIETLLPGLRPLFEKHATNIDWKLLAAIAYQESHWDPQATSPTGVRGMMMLTRGTAESFNVTDRTDPEQSIRGGSNYLLHIMQRVPQTIPGEERIWFALAAYNMGYYHMLDARKLTSKQKGNPDSWAEVKQRLPLLSQRKYYSQTTYGYARGQEAYNYVENIRLYQQSLVGHLQERERKLARETALSKGYPAVQPRHAL
ncbi:MAG: Membrane-bound lytic murein transglycosylase F [Candidatus Erwinia impunctatus]|nr:Membrane-bound lytic murein transglycosylase F [Culicoides impunctatus]